MNSDAINAIQMWINTPTLYGIVGRQDQARLIATAFLANGHGVLGEGEPGTGKTFLATVLTGTANIQFRRIQGSPNSSNNEIIGYDSLDLKTREKVFNPGPIFANLVFADELNRNQPKSVAGMTEAMQERQVTVGGNTYPLPEPWLLLATQNPTGSEGTYTLPAMLTDRFFMKIWFPRLTSLQRLEMLKLKRVTITQPDFSIEAKDIIEAQEMTRAVGVTDAMLEKLNSMIDHTHNERFGLSHGAGERAAIDLMSASQAWAAIDGRAEVHLADILSVFKPVLRHRVMPARRVINPYEEHKLVDEALDMILREAA